MKRAIQNCTVVKEALQEGLEKPLTEELNGREYCQGYQRSTSDDEPHCGCLDCKLNIFYEN